MITTATELQSSEDPLTTLAEEEEKTTNHDEWIATHYEDGLYNLESGKITRDEYLKQLKGERKELEKQSLVDHLTGILNRAGLDLEVERQLADANRLHRKTGEYLGSAIFIDVDNFKNINDIYGHQIGDEVLITYAQTIKKSIRPKDALGRYGGDEFVVFATEATQEQAQQLANRIREQIIKAIRQKFQQKGITLNGEQTISAGVSQLQSDDNPSSLLARADTALDYAKKSGKNKALIFDDKTMELKTK